MIMIENEIYCYVNCFLKWNISKEVKNTFLERLAFLTGEIKEKVSLQELSLGTKGERRSQRKRAGLQLKVPIDETIGGNLGNESLEENLCILGVP